VRLYHFRYAKAVAAAINSISGTKRHLVEPLGKNDDLLLILPSAPGENHSTDIRRAIAVIDLPRPQLSLQVWSYQISAEKKKQDPKSDEQVSLQMQDRFKGLKDTVNKANSALMKALQDGYGEILDAANEAQKKHDSIFDTTFEHYLTERYQDCVRKDRYCLGYKDALAIPPAGQGAANATLSRLLLFLIAVDDEKASDLVTEVIKKMNAVDNVQTPNCPDNLDNLRTLDEKQPTLCFVRFSEQLSNNISNRRNLHILRAALLDFLFEYKWTIVYGNDFIPYNLQQTTHLLDSYFDPIIEAFNEDVDEYVSCELRKVAEPNPKLKSTGLASNGMVQVATLSGSGADIEGKVNNYFDITPSLSLNDILNTGNQSNVASAMKGILEPKEILMLQALSNIGTQPRISAELTKQAKLMITPTSLDTASTAQLDIDFDVSEPSPPETVNQKAATKDLLDRVAEHHVISQVRVDGLKLFQISEFTMELTHPERGTPVPIVGQMWESIFGTTPGIRNLFRMPPYSKTEENRSVVIVRAVVVPTAMDIGLSFPFAADRIEDPVTDTTDPMDAVAQAGGRLRPFHELLTRCVLVGRNDCGAIKLSTTPEDLRNPTTP
jgi:CheY-specific phosphatase CheX